MAKEEVELEFEFSDDELANFLENFAEKIREGDVGLSFKGREEVEISPNQDHQLELSFNETEGYKKLDLEVELYEKLDTTETGRRKVKVEIV